MIVIWMIFCLLLLGFGAWGLIYLLIDRQARKEVAVSPRVPMAECPKHGMFDKRLMFQLEMPPAIRSSEMPLKVDVCPFCHDERMKGADSFLKNLKAGKTNV